MRQTQETVIKLRKPAGGPAPAWAFLGYAACFVGVLACGVGCERAPTPVAPTKHNAVGETSPASRDVLVFPPSLRVEDDAVNGFVEEAMNACASGEYERFRRLWSVREEPLTRGEFDQGWQAVREIRILALEKVRVNRNGNDHQASPDEGTIHYLILAEVRFDPSHRAGTRQPIRDVTLLLLREQAEWRIARAPKALREWIQERHGRHKPSDHAGDG